MATQPHPPETLLTELEAGVYLGGETQPIKPATLRRWRWASTGPVFHRIGGLIRYQVADLDAFKAAGRCEPQQAVA